jgi:hypothetical protein
MNKHKQALFQAVLARISLGAVPVDGVYWFDPKDARTAPLAPTAPTQTTPAPTPQKSRSPSSPSWPRALGRLQWFESAE